MDHSSRFWDRIAERYAKRPVADEATYAKKLQITRSYLQPEMEVLELGCGTGSTAIAHAPHVKHIHAIDLSSKMIGIAQRKANAENVGNITFAQSSIKALDMPDQSLDVVLALSVLHLIENKEEVILNIQNLLKPGGIFVSSTACIADSMRFFKYVAPIGNFLRLIPLVKVFSAQELVQSLTCAEFEIDHQWCPGKGNAVFIVAKKT